MRSLTAAPRGPRGFPDLAAAIQRLAGCPAGPWRALWSPEGVSAFLEGWEDAAAGSPAELEAFLRLFDPAVRVRFGTTASPRLECPSQWDLGGILMAASPRPVVGSVRITWGREELAPRGRAMAAAVGRIVRWWTPLGLDSVRWSMNWSSGPLAVAGREPPETPEPAMSDDDLDLMVRYAEVFLGIRRREAIPPWTLVSIRAREPIVKRAREVVLGHRSLGAFLINPEPFRPDWRLVEARATSECLTARLVPLDPDRAPDRLEMLAPPECHHWRWSIDGQPVRPHPLHPTPELFRFDLPADGGGRGAAPLVLRADRPEGRRTADPRVPYLYPNPALFVSAERTESYTYEPRFGQVDGRPFQYVILAAGGIGLSGFAAGPDEPDKSAQPLPLEPGQPEESDAELLARASERVMGRLARRADVERLLAGRFPWVRAAACREDSWFDAGPPPRLVRGVEVTVRAGPSGPDDRVDSDLDDGRTERLRVSLERYLEARLPEGRVPRVRVEWDHE